MEGVPHTYCMLRVCLSRGPQVFLHTRSLLGASSRTLMDLKALVSSLNDFASPSLAESWDNVGLLVEPSPPHSVSTLFLTNDLTEEVMEEALHFKADLILSYHPPIFRPLKRITWKSWKERLVIKAFENRVAVYSPHTAYDAIPNGVNDWLAKGLGACTTTPLQPSMSPSYPSGLSHRIEFCMDSSQAVESFLAALQVIPGTSVYTLPSRSQGTDQTHIVLSCAQAALLSVMGFLSKDKHLCDNIQISSLQKPLLPSTGMGRLCKLIDAVSLKAVVERIKKHLALPHVRLALGVGKTLDSLVTIGAVCAGSGSSVLQGVDADLYLTGEMSHHEVLDAVARGTSVVLCEHSNTERGFLLELKDTLAAHLENKVQVVVSKKDRDPLEVV
ncbi:NIF3-like protein 1 isoform X1 [Pleurodeles waltl]|uniref:NIF3-like protein 1 isoform X1 n=1 Tax=Pleurodeles waltl TaxID=8319 RepID=UPI00370988DC